MSLPLKLSSQLSTRRLEVLLCVIAGDTTAEIAGYLQLSPSSVKRHINLLSQGCGAHRRAELVQHWADRLFLEPAREAAE